MRGDALVEAFPSGFCKNACIFDGVHIAVALTQMEAPERGYALTSLQFEVRHQELCVSCFSEGYQLRVVCQPRQKCASHVLQTESDYWQAGKYPAEDHAT